MMLHFAFEPTSKSILLLLVLLVLLLLLSEFGSAGK